MKQQKDYLVKILMSICFRKRICLIVIM